MRMKIVKIEFQSESLLIKKCASPNKRPSTSPPKLHCTWHLCWASGHATDVWDPSEGSMSAEMEDMCIVSNMWDQCIDAKNEGRQKWMIVEWRWQVHHGILCTSSSIIKKCNNTDSTVQTREQFLHLEVYRLQSTLDTQTYVCTPCEGSIGSEVEVCAIHKVWNWHIDRLGDRSSCTLMCGVQFVPLQELPEGIVLAYTLCKRWLWTNVWASDKSDWVKSPHGSYNFTPLSIASSVCMITWFQHPTAINWSSTTELTQWSRDMCISEVGGQGECTAIQPEDL